MRREAGSVPGLFVWRHESVMFHTKKMRAFSCGKEQQGVK